MKQIDEKELKKNLRGRRKKWNIKKSERRKKMEEEEKWKKRKSGRREKVEEGEEEK